MLIDLQGGGNNLGGQGGGGGGSSNPPLGFIDFPQPPALPVMPQAPFNYPAAGTSSTHTASAPFNYNIPPYPMLDQEKKDLNTQFLQVHIQISIIFEFEHFVCSPQHFKFNVNGFFCCCFYLHEILLKMIVICMKCWEWNYRRKTVIFHLHTLLSIQTITFK